MAPANAPHAVTYVDRNGAAFTNVRFTRGQVGFIPLGCAGRLIANRSKAKSVGELSSASTLYYD